MRTKTKNTIAILLSAVMMVIAAFLLMTQLTEPVYADDPPPPTSGKCGDNIDWNFDAATNILTISGKGSMYDYDWFSNPSEWYIHYKNRVEKVVVGEGVTRIGSSAFAALGNLAKAELPTTLVEIGEDAFMEVGSHDFNGNITVEFTVTLPDNLQVIGSGAFSGSTITNIKIPKGVKKLKRTFQYGFIKTIDLGEVEEIGEYTFAECWLESVTLPKTLKVIGIDAFAAVNLTEVTIPEGVTTLGGMDGAEDMAAFEQCYNLKRIVIPSTLTSITGMELNMCPNLEEVDFRGTEEQWKQLTAGINPNSELGKVINNPDIKKEYNYTKDLSDIANAKIVLSAATFTYNGNVQKPVIESVTLGTETLEEGRDYIISEENTASKDVGIYTITISGRGNYIGSASASYSIEPYDIKNACIVVAKCITTYNGEPHTYNGQLYIDNGIGKHGPHLLQGTDYTAVYENNVHPGEATVNFYGMGNCTGTLTCHFTIAKGINPLEVKGKTVKIKYKKLKKKNQKIKRTRAITVNNHQGLVTYKKSKGHKKIVINSKTGKVSVKKGLKKGTYKVSVNISAAGNADYNEATETVTFTIKVK